MLPALPPGLVITHDADWTVKDAQGRVLVTFQTPESDVSGTWRVFSSSKGDVLVADRWATTMGMGVESWTLTLFKATGGPVVQLQAEDWGLDGVRERDGHLEVLASDWVWPRFGKPRESYHFVGRWFAYTGDALRPLGQTLARPFLFSFADERSHSWTHHLLHSAIWLRHAHPYPGGDPRLGPETAPRVKGTVTNVQVHDNGIQLQLGQPLWIAGFDGPSTDMPRVDYVAEHGQLMPASYRPADAKQAWEGRAAELATYGKDELTTRVLWLK